MRLQKYKIDRKFDIENVRKMVRYLCDLIEGM